MPGVYDIYIKSEPCFDSGLILSNLYKEYTTVVTFFE